jgi:hypothetical protein
MMVEIERRAIVWDTIERIAFRPASDKDRRAWLEIYAKTLAKVWQMDQGNVQIRRRDGGELAGFSVPFLNLDCDCGIEGRSKYSVTVSRVEDSAQAVCWHLHVDPDFASSRGFCSSSATYPLQNVAENLEDDVAAVLDGMIFHPRNHAHGKKLGIGWSAGPEDTMLSTDEVRLGGGIENAFVFLAHLRYQFCLLSEDARSEERRRLERLFLVSIRDKARSVPAKDVLNLK